jgi:hypothetical protein
MLMESREVTIPEVGRSLRVEPRSAEGEAVGVVEYRRPADPRSSAIDPTLTSVVSVTAAPALIAQDATRTRRIRDRARQAWYAWHRQWRFARFMGVLPSSGPATERMPSSGPAISTRRRAASFDTTALELCLLTH